MSKAYQASLGKYQAIVDNALLQIKELDLAMLGTQTASIFTLRFAENA